MRDSLFDGKYFQNPKISKIREFYNSFVFKREPLFSILKKKKNKGSTLLDIGCGDGAFLRYAEDWFDCTGIDISKEGLAIAKKRLKKSKLLNKSIYRLGDFKPNSLDVIVCFDVLEHVFNLEKILASISRLLKPKGIFVFSVPNGDSLGKARKWEKWYGFSDKTHLWFMGKNEWNFLLCKNGLIPIKIFYNGLIDPPYFSFIPKILQLLFFKYFLQGLSFMGFPLTSSLGEILSFLTIKNPGLDSANYEYQLKLSKSEK
jgi:SAM-dependent methyltransferase